MNLCKRSNSEKVRARDLWHKVSLVLGKIEAVKMSSDEFIAHVRKWDKKTQSVEKHLGGVAELSQKFASKVNLPLAGKLIGLMHDLGKYSCEFQEYISEASKNENQAYAKKLKGKVDHATAGARKIYEDFKNNTLSQVLAACVASHHTGLYDFVDQQGESPFFNRINNLSKNTLKGVLKNCDSEICRKIQEIVSSSAILEEFETVCSSIRRDLDNEDLCCFHQGLLLRFMFSCLIDADRLDAANFEKPESAAYRNINNPTDWYSLKDLIESHLATFKSQNSIDELRSDISRYCLDAASRPKGVFTLTVPTGGGKTLASLRFAIHHAIEHSGKNSRAPVDRIIYVIPYTSIIEQNAETVRKILGDENVLEHHSNLVPEQDTWRCRLLSENWDAPVVFTTSIQFLNALFASSTRDIRRMHQLANSVIIFDEIQTLPIKTVHLFNNAINFLVQTCGSSVVLCTATQPLLHKVNKKFGAIRVTSDNVIIPDDAQFFDKFRRTKIHYDKPFYKRSVCDIAELAIQQAKETGSTLIIVNTKNTARALYEHLQKNEDISNNDIKSYHLSTNMCPAHRKAVLATIRKDLDVKNRVICVSTQLIEAGVDIDFGSVIRSLAGLDSIAQAAGRCNRNGHRSDLAPVFVVNPDGENLKNLPDIQEGQKISLRVFDDFSKNQLGNDLLHPKAMEKFYQYYFYKRAEEMKYTVRAGYKGIKCDTDLLNLLSSNIHSVSEYFRIQKTPPHFCLRQAFKTAYDAFHVIDAPTDGVIVPYGKEGRQVIAELVAIFNKPDHSIEDQKKVLYRAQRYSVNVFPILLKKLSDTGCIQEVLKGSGIYYLDERHYDDTVGITLEETMEMIFLNV